MARSAFIIAYKDKEEERLCVALFKRLRLKFRIINEQELEDAGLAFAMAKVDKTKVADRESVMRQLRGGNEAPC